MTILDRILGGDDPPKIKKDPFSTILKASNEIGINNQDTLGGLLKVASGYTQNIPKTNWVNPETKQVEQVYQGAFSPSGMGSNTVRRGIKTDGLDGTVKEPVWYVKMKDNENNEFPYPVTKLTHPELFDLLEAGNIPQERLNELTSRMFGGTSNTPGGSQFGYSDGIDGGEIRQAPVLRLKENDYALKPIDKVALPVAKDTPFTPFYPEIKKEDVTLKNPKTPIWKEIWKPFEWNEFDSQIAVKKKRSLFDMIKDFPFTGMNGIA